MRLEFLAERPTKKTTKYLLIFSFVLLVITFPLVIHLLELSNFPGTLNDTQLGFNGVYIKSMFSLMSNEELSIFILANLFDYVGMIAYGSFLFSSTLTLTRNLQEGSVWQKIGYIISIFGILSACSDGIENIFLLLMASAPLTFPNWLAIPHSFFALVKFILLYIAMGWVVLTAFLYYTSILLKRMQNQSEINN